MIKCVDPKMTKLFHGNFKKLGDTPQAVHWGSKESAFVRYASWLDTVGGVNGKKVLDIGCGLGHLYEFVKMRTEVPFRWVGVELEKSFIEGCNEKFFGDDHFSLIEGNFMDDANDVNSNKWILKQHFHEAVLMGTISLVPPKDLFEWIKRLEQMDIDCFMIEFLRKGISKGPFYKYDLFEIRKMFDAKMYEYKIVFHELPHVFNLYAYPKQLKLQARLPLIKGTNGKEKAE